MTMGEMLTQELDIEVKATRTMLERVPMDRLDFRPHERSTTLGRLATHVSTLLRMTARTMEADELDFAKVDPAEYMSSAQSTDELLANLDRSAAAARAALASATDEQLQSPWTLRGGDRVFFTLPRWLVHRQMVMNHVVHHRGQLAVYLRMVGAPVPGMYGPSADEM